MRIAIGSDHAGYDLKCAIINYLQRKNMEVYDVGAFSKDSVDYPDYALQVCQILNRKNSDLGILICYTGIGMSIAANKVKGIRAALVTTEENAKLTREHNDANILCLGAKDVDFEKAKKIIDVFLTTQFAGGRHLQRVTKVMNIEKNEKK
jgi:ribose-5-phosphate isomerase B